MQDRLRQLLWSLTSDPLTFSLPAKLDTGKKVARLQRTLNGLAIAAAQLPDAPAVLNSSNRQVTGILRKPDGSLHVLTPTEERA